MERGRSVLSIIDIAMRNLVAIDLEVTLCLLEFLKNYLLELLEFFIGVTGLFCHNMSVSVAPLDLLDRHKQGEVVVQFHAVGHIGR